jgi:hypothetical protein
VTLPAENIRQVETTTAVAPLTPMALIERAMQNNAGMDVIEKFMDMQERWDRTQARKAFDEAIAMAKAEIAPIQRNATGHNSKKYADFAAIAVAVDPILSKFGLSYRFRTVQGDRINVTCILSHKAGHFEETTLSGPADTSGNKNAIQAIGSTLTYLQRYSLVQMLGLAAAHDDDGKAAAGKLLVTQEQADQLRELMEAHGKDTKKFLKWVNQACKADRIEDIPAEFFQSCVDAIQAPVSK